MKSEDLDVGQVAMKMGLSYRTVESLLARTSGAAQLAGHLAGSGLAGTGQRAVDVSGRGVPPGRNAGRPRDRVVRRRGARHTVAAGSAAAAASADHAGRPRGAARAGGARADRLRAVRAVRAGGAGGAGSVGVRPGGRAGDAGRYRRGAGRCPAHRNTHRREPLTARLIACR
ncbi:hypothetical protein [Streptomyces sp. NBC_01142]|uniref:hypothetical protein n=1 Tax=Streptomyces sp. NBC_01142 TaxID=2975865 RepID=UPI002B1D8B70|nr:hypothetical protein [Streptomyces sp. NBC_01142]